MKKAPSKKQLAARKKFTAMVKKRAKEKKAAKKIGFVTTVAKLAARKLLKKKAGIGDTLVRIPSKTRKNKNVIMQRDKKGMFTDIGAIGSTKGAFKNIAEVKKANKAAGFYFFEPSTMRYFNSKIESKLIAGKYFITSDTFISSDGKYKDKKFKIRIANNNGSIANIDKDFKTKIAALTYLKKNY